MKEKKSLKILKIVVLGLVISWVILFLIDYTRARNNKDLLFCIKEETKEYPDGTVYSCTSLGYKLYRYNRSSINTTLQFGPIFMKEKTK